MYLLNERSAESETKGVDATVTVDGLKATMRNLSVMTNRSRRMRDDVGAVVACATVCHWQCARLCCIVVVVASARWHQVATVHNCTSGCTSALNGNSALCGYSVMR